jgi:Family of unknown function (DUF6494)
MHYLREFMRPSAKSIRLQSAFNPTGDRHGRGHPQYQRAQVPQEAWRHCATRDEKAVRDAVAAGRLTGGEKLPAKAVVTLGGVDLKFEVDGDIELT